MLAKRRLGFACLTICLFSAAACSTTDEKQLTSLGLVNAKSVSLHAIYDARLRDSMREIDNLMFERMLTELEIDQERRQKSAQIGRLADEMGRAVDYIIDSLPRLPLDENEKITFLTLADQLRNQVKILRKQADHNYIDTIPDILEHITTTCMTCHQLFRDPG